MILKVKHSKERQHKPGIYLATVVAIYAKRNGKGEYVKNVLDEIIICVDFILSNGEQFQEQFFFGGVNEEKFNLFCKKIKVVPDGNNDVSMVIGKRLWIRIDKNEYNVFSIIGMLEYINNTDPGNELHQVKNENKEPEINTEQKLISTGIKQVGEQGVLFDTSSY